MPQALIDSLAKATAVLAAAEAPVAIVYALPHYGAEAARTTTAALANIAMAASGDDAAQTLFILPQEANVLGMRDAGAAADLLPGHRPAAAEASRAEMQRAWGAQLPAATGLTFEQMGANGNIKALVVLDDNPLMLAPDTNRVRKWLQSLEFIAVIDSLPTDTANLAHAVLPETSAWAKEGTTTSADRRVLRLNKGAAHGESRQGWRILSELGARLAERLQPGEIRIKYQSAAEVMDESRRSSRSTATPATATWIPRSSTSMASARKAARHRCQRQCRTQTPPVSSSAQPAAFHQLRGRRHPRPGGRPPAPRRRR